MSIVQRSGKVKNWPLFHLHWQCPFDYSTYVYYICIVIGTQEGLRRFGKKCWKLECQENSDQFTYLLPSASGVDHSLKLRLQTADVRATFVLSEAELPDGFIFKPKIPIWVNLGGPCSVRFWNIL
jgi:hypothetical protein